MSGTVNSHRRYDIVKRLLDVGIAAVGLVVTAPLQAGIAALVRWRLGSPVLFRQQRPGRYGKPFTLVKFRTMLPTDEAQGRISDADRLTPFGIRLRSTSLDELPTLWNVLRGDMSMVGPRPLLLRYTQYLSEREIRRLDVRPGVTGPAQISGRNALGWDERLALDVSYVERRSLTHDILVLLRTAITVAGRKGFIADAESTMQNLDIERGAGNAL